MVCINFRTISTGWRLLLFLVRGVTAWSALKGISIGQTVLIQGMCSQGWDLVRH
ncbi:hypothetical protein PDIG_43880 [Penicillium digitatum PHI26]|uniref:Uncharacterized protein n=2 Tax=Penicillium digitatum TaxID=36651 RepID=K9FTM0_PEND2|nr:hypothetical protein PDIP_35110 [Penicillium digitatum Pd1]EKV12464.1 hypothetical protein PDIG_43880 [Penicillium digitatum PHI26]EKV16528.1 hypothetical protein PDIP_35110 [Penicillium digitatum Pd1]